MLEVNLAADPFSEEDYNLIQQVAKWPSLRGDAFFQNRLNQYLLAFAKNCLKPSAKRKECLQKGHDLWANSFREVESTYQLLALSKGHIPIGHLVRSVALNKMGELYCARPLMVLELKKAFD